MSPCALSYASDGGAARICQRGPKRGSEATERGEGVAPTVGRFFENSCMKTAFSCTLNTISRGSLCTGTNSLLFFFFYSFPNELVSGEHFPFSLSFFLFFFFPFLYFFYSPINRGGAMVPLCPLATPVLMYLTEIHVQMSFPSIRETFVCLNVVIVYVMFSLIRRHKFCSNISKLELNLKTITYFFFAEVDSNDNLIWYFSLS